MPAMTKSASFFVCVVAVLSVAACGKKAGGGAPGNQKDGADGIKAVFTELAAAYEAKDYKKGAELTKSLLPDAESVKKVVKPDVAAELIEKIVAPGKEIPPDDERVARLLVPGEGRTEIKVYGQTTEEIIAYKEGTPAFNEFPGGAKKVAEAILKPGVTFYEVEVTEPGKDSGTKYHLFFWDGSQWHMMGAAWRALR
jgi:hypothetical protein